LAAGGPNFESFIALFQPIGEAEPYQPSDEEWTQAMSVLRTPFDALAPVYLQGTEEERRELEAELWKEVESRGMSDEERRGVEELVERLRSSVEG
jgi:hypothetical protein